MPGMLTVIAYMSNARVCIECKERVIKNMNGIKVVMTLRLCK